MLPPSAVPHLVPQPQRLCLSGSQPQSPLAFSSGRRSVPSSSSHLGGTGQSRHCRSIHSQKTISLSDLLLACRSIILLLPLGVVKPHDIRVMGFVPHQEGAVNPVPWDHGFPPLLPRLVNLDHRPSSRLGLRCQRSQDSADESSAKTAKPCVPPTLLLQKGQSWDIHPPCSMSNMSTVLMNLGCR